MYITKILNNYFYVLMLMGVKLEESKVVALKQIEKAPLPKKVIIPLVQHIGKACKPLVNVGDYVKVGQKIGDSEEAISAPVHASVSGIVKEISVKETPLGKQPCILIESDGKDLWYKFNIPKVNELSKEDIINLVREAGIVGMGGAAFPTHIKLKSEDIDTFILNGAECEPYLSCDYRLMVEHTDEIIKGMRLIMKCLNVKMGFIGIEKNKPKALQLFRNKLKNTNIRVVALKSIYPQGAEKMLIYAITKRKVPSGGLPLDVGVVVNNVGTVKAVYDALYCGKPLIERVITIVDNKPRNLLVRIGTLVKDIVKSNKEKLVLGGPMMGIAQATLDVPIIKGTSGIIFLDKIAMDGEPEDCIRCGKCVEVCPMNLLPSYIAKYAKYDKVNEANGYNALDCFECGCCAYVCPAHIPLVHWIRYIKKKIEKCK